MVSDKIREDLEEIHRLAKASDAERLTERIVNIAAISKRTFALLPQSPQEGMGLPRLDEGLIEAAYRAHYGQAGNPTGTDLTVNGRNWTFAEGFRRMWSGVRKEIKRRAASSHSQEQENGDE